MTDGGVTITKVIHHQDIPFELLELADPSREQINSYLDSGQCFVAKLGAQVIGVIVLKELSPTSVEIKNIAVVEAYQGRGYGKLLLKWADEFSRKFRYQKIIIGTGNSSFSQLALYQKVGFGISHIRKNFFLEHYPEPIFEGGVQCKHMVVLEKRL